MRRNHADQWHTEMSFYEHTWEVSAGAVLRAFSPTIIFSCVGETSRRFTYLRVFFVSERKKAKAIIVYSVRCMWHRYFHRFVAGTSFFSLLLIYAQRCKKKYNMHCLAFVSKDYVCECHSFSLRDFSLIFFPLDSVFIFISPPFKTIVHFDHFVYGRIVITTHSFNRIESAYSITWERVNVYTFHLTRDHRKKSHTHTHTKRAQHQTTRTQKCKSFVKWPKQQQRYTYSNCL